MEKIKKKLNIIVTAILIFAISICVIATVQIISGNQPKFLNYSFYYVLSGSMEPTIETNAHIVVKDVDTDTLEVGDIITFLSEDNAIYGSANTHRIVEITTDDDGITCFITQGDANLVADELPVYEDQICGKVVFYTKAFYWISVFFDFIQTGFGFVTVIIFPLMIVVYYYVKDFTKSVNKYIKQKALEEILNSEENKDDDVSQGEKTE